MEGPGLGLGLTCGTNFVDSLRFLHMWSALALGLCHMPSPSLMHRKPPSGPFDLSITPSHSSSTRPKPTGFHVGYASNIIVSSAVPCCFFPAGYRSVLVWLPVLYLAGFSSRPQVSNIIAAIAEHCWLVCLKGGYRSAALLLPMLHPAAFPTSYRSAALFHLGLLALALPLATPLAPGPSPQASM